MIRIAIAGVGGRMGLALVETLNQTSGATLMGAIENPDSAMIGADSGELAGIGRNNVMVSDSLNEVLGSVDTLIDFSAAEATIANVTRCAQEGVRMVIGTTGLDELQLEAVKSAGNLIPICMSSNFSTGVNLCYKLAELAAKVLGDDFDIEITEAHHRHKLDAPSGTALSMGEIIASALGHSLEHVAVFDRVGCTDKRRKGTIGFRR